MGKIVLSKKTLIILLILLLIILVGIFFYVYKLINQDNENAPSDYIAVYLQTGEIYFGKIDWFPWPSLKNVWYIQKTLDPQNQAQLGILPLKNVFWSPIDKIYLNPKQINFWTYLKKSSQLVKVFENPDILNNQNNFQQQNLQQQNQNNIINENKNTTTQKQ